MVNNDPSRRPGQRPATPPHANATGSEARQGRRGLPVLMVLIGGLILAAIVWAIVEFYGMSIEDESRQLDTSGDAQQQTAPAGDPSSLPPAPQN